MNFFFSHLPSPPTSGPIVTGTSVLAVKYHGGVMIACDTLGSYGSLARFRSLSRVRAVGPSGTLVACGGDQADFEQVLEFLDDLVETDACHMDGIQTTPKEFHSYLTRVMYNRRNKMNPLWCSLVVAGPAKGFRAI